jgi:hypothetical protein
MSTKPGQLHSADDVLAALTAEAAEEDDEA